MLHPTHRRHQTLRRTELTRDETGQLVRRATPTLDDLYERIDEHLAEL